MNFIKNFCLSLFVLLTSASLVFAEPVQLKVNVKEGEVYELKGVTTSTGSIKVPLMLNALISQYLGLDAEKFAGQNQWLLDMKDNLVCLAKVIDVDAEGNSTFEYTPENRSINLVAKLLDVVQYNINFEVNDKKMTMVIFKDGEKQFTQELGVLATGKMNLTLAPSGRIVKIMGMDIDEMITAALKSVETLPVDKQLIVEFVQNCLDYYAYPEKAIKEGDSWNHHVALSIPLDELPKEEKVSLKSLDVDIQSDNTVVEIKDNHMIFKTITATRPTEWQWGMAFETFGVDVDLNYNSEAQTVVDITTGMPATMDFDHSLKGQVDLTLPAISEAFNLAPMNIPVEFESKSKWVIDATQEPQLHADSSPS